VRHLLLIRIVVVSVVVAAVIFYASSGLFETHGGSEDDRQDNAAVLVARHYLPAFSLVHAADVTVRTFPKGFVPPGAFHAIAELGGDNETALFSTAVAIPDGQPLTRALVNELGKSHGMASVLSPGQTAVSFSVDAVRGVGGWIQPGDTIAIFETRRDGDVRVGLSRRSKLLFSSVRVLAVNQKRLGSAENESKTHDDSGDSDPGSSIVTVVLHPFDAARLVESREDGHLSVLLRPLGDDAVWSPFLIGKNVHE